MPTKRVFDAHEIIISCPPNICFMLMKLINDSGVASASYLG